MNSIAFSEAGLGHRRYYFSMGGGRQESNAEETARQTEDLVSLE